MAFVKINGKQIADAAISNNHVSPTAAIAETKLNINWNAHTEILVDKKVVYKVQINDQEVGGSSQLNVNALVSGTAVLSTGTDEGVITDAPKNKVVVRDGATKDSPFKDAEGNVVYGRMVRESNQYVVKFYTEVGGSDTPFTMPANKTVDLVYYKRGNLLNVPEDYAISEGGSFVEGATDVIAEFNINQLAQDLGITLGNDGQMSLNRSIIDEILVQTRGIVNDDVRANETIDEVVTARGVAANLNARLTNIETSVTDEETRALAAEGVLQDNIDAEESARISADSALQTELDATQTGAGLGSNGSYTANNAANYISTASSLKDADNKLDAALKVEELARIDGDSTLQSNIDTEEQARIDGDQAIRDDLASTSEGEGAALVGIEAGSGLTGSTVQSVLENLESRLASQESGGGAEVTATHTRDANTANDVFEAGSFADLEARLEDIENVVDAQVTDLASDIASEQTRAENAEAALQSELDATQTGAGLGANGSYTANGSANYISAASSLKDADNKLDTALKSEETARTNADSALQTELDGTQTGAGLNANGSYSANGSANYISTASSLKDADNKLDTALKSEETARTNADNTLQSNIDAEALARANADDTLQDNIEAEQLARENADEAITDRIDVSLNPDGTLIAGTQIHDHFKYVFAAVGGETSVSLTGGQKFQYGDDSLDVYINGVLQAEGYHYTEIQDNANATRGTGVDFSPETLVAGDIVILKWYINNAE